MQRGIGVASVLKTVGHNGALEAILLAARPVGQARDKPGGVAETLLFQGEGIGLLQVEHVRHEILRRRVLLETAHEVGHGHVVLLGPDDGHVVEERADGVADGVRLRRRHSRKHLVIDAGGDAPLAH